MDDSTSELASAIGERVATERRSRRWTLDQLAEATGVSRRMLVNVEQGAVNPSVGTLLKVAGALGVGLPALVEPPRSASVTVIRDGESPVLWSSPAGGYGRLVASAGLRDTTELWDWTLMPRDVQRSDGHTPGTKELIHVREGWITVEVGEQIVTLEPGDAVSFPGDVAHSYANHGTIPVRFALTVFEPGSGPATRSAVSHD